MKYAALAVNPTVHPWRAGFLLRKFPAVTWAKKGGLCGLVGLFFIFQCFLDVLGWIPG